MSNKSLSVTFHFLGLLIACNVAAGQSLKNNKAATDILKKVSEKLNSMRQISYNYKREWYYYSENIQGNLDEDTYLDLSTAINSNGFKFKSGSGKTRSVFNGTEYFLLDEQKKTIWLNIKPSVDYLNSVSFLYNSILTLRNTLPLLIADTSVTKKLTDTLIKKHGYYVVTFSLKNKVFNYTGGYRALTIITQTPFDIIIDKKTLLPFQVVERRDNNNDFTRTTFAKINGNAPEPSIASWYYTTYLPGYTQARKDSIVNLIAPGSIMNDWALPGYDAKKNDSVRLGDYRGKLVLLDFWIKNCGPCQAGFPHLEELQGKFAPDKFQLLSVNGYDTENDIEFYFNKLSPSYKMLYNGEELAKALGVNGYPTAILIDKNGKVIYSGSFDQGIIEKIIVQNL